MRCPGSPEGAIASPTPAAAYALAEPIAERSPPPPQVKVVPYHSTPKDDDGDLDTDRLKNVILPASLLAGGVIVGIGAALLEHHRLTDALELVALRIGVGTILMLAGMYAATVLRGLRLGPFWTVAFKLAAMTVAPSAVLALIYPLVGVIPIFGPLVALGVDFVLYFALLGVLFDLDQADTWYCVGVMFILNLAVYFLLHG
jgi:hypothetical protein